MKNFIEFGDVLDVVAPAGGFVSGMPVIIGSLLGVASTTVPAGSTGAVKIGGVFELPKGATEAWTVGQAVYWTGTAATTTSGSTLIGYASEPAANPSSVGRVRFNEHA